jgi:dephospho-CoA kinase
VKTGQLANPGELPLLILGLLGGVASGKSLVADQLTTLGAGILDGDRAGHEVLQQSEVQRAIFDRWGEEVFEPRAIAPTHEPDGTHSFSQNNRRINRAALARIVFAPTSVGREALNQLEQITHPRIKVILEEQMVSLAARKIPLAVLDAPVMIKAGWHNLCNEIMFVEAPREARLARALRRGWDEAEFDRREAAQEPLEYKKSLAQVVIDNSGSPEQTRKQIISWWETRFPAAGVKK